jgi:hypothetical protein
MEGVIIWRPDDDITSSISVETPQLQMARFTLPSAHDLSLKY